MPYKFKPFRGPLSWSFIDPDLHIQYTAKTRDDLLKQITETRKQNNLEDIPHIDIILDNYLCSKPENMGSCEFFNLPRTFMQYVEGGVAYFLNMRYKKIVPLEEAQRRANICLTKCTPTEDLDYGFNRNVSVNPLEDYTNQMFEAQVGEQPKVEGFDKLHTCTCCSCPLKSKVYYGGEINNSKYVEASLPDHCWQKKLKQ